MAPSSMGKIGDFHSPVQGSSPCGATDIIAMAKIQAGVGLPMVANAWML